MVSSFPIGGGVGVCNPKYFTQQDLLDLYDRILPESYLAAIKNVGPGYELLQAYAKMWERVSLAIGRVECGLFITLSHGGIKSTGLVEFYRDSGVAGSVTVLSGTIVSCSKNGAQFRTIENAVFSGATLGPVGVTVEALYPGWEWNATGQILTPDGEVLVGDIDTIDLPVQSPPFGDPTIRVRNIDTFIDGQAAMLDALGADRGLPRSADEPDDSYRIRIRTLPDTVSRDAILRLLNHYTAQFGLTPYDFIETWELRYQTCWDGPNTTLPPSAQGVYDPNLFCYDDPRPTIPFRNRWLSEDDHRGAFIVVLPRLDRNDWGMAYDDPVMTLAGYTKPSGLRRAHSAYDVPSFGVNPDILQGAYDGLGESDPLYRNQIYKNLNDMLQAAKAGGVSGVIELEGS